LLLCCAKIIKDCENSGNGFGQRDESDENFGHYERSAATDGDERVSFVKTAIGQRFHHLYFWHLADLMGVLKNVLNVLSAEVAADTDTVPRETTSTQRSRVKRSSPTVDEEQEERRAKKKFREALELSLKDIGDGLKGGNIVRAITALRVAIRAEETLLQTLKFKSLMCTENEKELCDELMQHHGNRVAEYELEMAVLKRKN
jgi:hypothetical protein